MKTRRTDAAGTQLHYYRGVSRQHYFLLKVAPSHVMIVRDADFPLSAEHLKRAEEAGLYIPISLLFHRAASAESRLVLERAAINEVVELTEDQIASPYREKGSRAIAAVRELMDLERQKSEDPRKK